MDRTYYAAVESGKRNISLKEELVEHFNTYLKAYLD